MRYTVVVPAAVSREPFFHRESEALFRHLETLSQRSGVSRGVAFEDWLTAMVCALAAETKETEYLAMIGRHTAGTPGQRGCDQTAALLAEASPTPAPGRAALPTVLEIPRWLAHLEPRLAGIGESARIDDHAPRTPDRWPATSPPPEPRDAPPPEPDERPFPQRRF